MKPQVRISQASDYAGIVSGDYSFYYGYEFDRKDDEPVYGFEYSQKDVTVFAIEYSEMEKYEHCPKQYDTVKCLLFGIGIFLSLKGGEK